MNPDTNLPPSPDPDMQSQPTSQDLPAESIPPMAPAPEAPGQTQAMHDPSAQQPAPAPQPMPVTTTPTMPEQPISAQPQPLYTPEAASQVSKGKSGKKTLFLIGGIIVVLVVIGAAIAIFASKSALIGSLVPDSYEGLKYQRPSTWVKDTSETSAVGYHPKASLGKSSDNKPTYALKMNISAQKNVFQSTPNNLKPADKKALQSVIDTEISQASSKLLPSKSGVGCDTDPTYKDPPKKVTLGNSFLAVKYSFTCTSGIGSKQTAFYYVVLDIVPNDTDIEYILNIGAASKQVYDTNMSKIDTIIGSVTF